MDELPWNSDQALRLLESERAQIGHEIHDALLPLIFAASASVQSLSDDPKLSPNQAQRLEQISGWLTDALQTGRQLLGHIYPPELTGNLWWHAAADTIARRFDSNATQSDTPAKIDWQIDSSLPPFSEPIAVAAYRIVVEAIRNAVRHGEASEISIQAKQMDDRASIKIVDNGRGFDPKSVPQGHYGITTMIGRAELVGGTMTIESKPGGPTCVEFVVAHTAKQ